MNRTLAQAAVDAVTDPNVEGDKGFCSKFVRQVVARVYGDRYAALFGASAIKSGQNFLEADLADSIGLQESLHHKPEVGDILFKLRHAGPFGHVGICVAGGKVAENSSTSIGRVSGAKGFRTLLQYGAYDAIGRLPDPAVKPKARPAATEAPAAKFYTLMSGSTKLFALPITAEGAALAPVRRWADHLGFDVDWDGEVRRVLLDGHEVQVEVTLIGGAAYLPVRVLADFSGLTVTTDDKQRIVRVAKPLSAGR